MEAFVDPETAAIEPSNSASASPREGSAGAHPEPVHLYAIHTSDDLSVGLVDKGTRFGGSTLRMNNYTVHKEYQALTADPNSPNYIRKVCAGPMESDDGKYMIGSFFLVHSTRSQAEAFVHNDPFYINKVWEKVIINRYVAPNGVRPVRAEMDGDDRTTLRMVTDW
jgi:uncharacterized protein YciI